MLSCQGLTRYASPSKEKITKILHSFHIAGNEIGLFQNDPQQWESLAQGARLCYFTDILLPLIHASHRLSNHKALWLVEPPPASPDQIVHVEEESNWSIYDQTHGCAIHDTPYHASLSIEDNKRIDRMLFDACCATQGFGDVMFSVGNDSDFKSESPVSEHSALSDDEVSRTYGSKTGRQTAKPRNLRKYT